MSKFTPVYTTRFRRGRRALIKRGYDITKLERIVDLLINGRPLPANCKDHPLKGSFRGCRECHVEGEGDWLLIYRADGQKLILIFIATGTHDDLFS